MFADGDFMSRIVSEKRVETVIGITQLCEQNPRRKVLVLAGIYTNYTISTRPSFDATDGILVTAENQPLILNSVDHDPLQTMAWFADTSGIAGPLTVIEAIEASESNLAGMQQSIDGLKEIIQRLLRK